MRVSNRVRPADEPNKDVRQARVALSQSDNHYEALMAEVAIAEQARIGRDLHDTVGQDLAALALSAERASRQSECRPASEVLAQLAEGIRGALVGLRAAARGLTCGSYDSESLVMALNALAASVEAHHGIECRLDVRSLDAVSADVADHLYRIASEAVANAVHHAQPKSIHIRLAPQDGRLTLRVIDDGIGMPACRTESGIGTWIMRSRAAAIQAEFEIRAGESCGTVVTCRLKGTGHGPPR